MIIIVQMDEENILEVLSDAFQQCEDRKKILREILQKLMNAGKLFVGAVQDHNRSQHRADVYHVIHPVYLSSTLEKTLSNCFVCSKCSKIFFHLKTAGTAPFATHSCFKLFKKNIATAEKMANDAKEMAKKQKLRSLRQKM